MLENGHPIDVIYTAFDQVPPSTTAAKDKGYGNQWEYCKLDKIIFQ